MPKTTSKKATTKKVSKTPPKKEEPKIEVEDEDEALEVGEEEEEETSEPTNGDEGEEETIEQEDEETASPKKKKQRRVVNKESLGKDIDDICAKLAKAIDNIGHGKPVNARTLKGIRNSMLNVKKGVPRAIKSKSPNAQKKVSGFVLPCVISKELSDFLGLKEGDTISRTEVTNAMCVYVKLKPDEKREHMLKWKHLNPGGKRDLQHAKNKMIINPDETLKKLLKYDDYIQRVKEGKITKKVTDSVTGEVKTEVVTDPSLYYWAAQLLIKNHFLETVKTPKN